MCLSPNEGRAQERRVRHGLGLRQIARPDGVINQSVNQSDIPLSGALVVVVDLSYLGGVVTQSSTRSVRGEHPIKLTVNVIEKGKFKISCKNNLLD